MARDTIELARTKCQAREYDAATEMVAKIVGLLSGDRSDNAAKLRLTCVEVEADVLLGKRDLSAALHKYEQCLTARSRIEDRTSEDCMQLLFKLERTIGALAVSEVDAETDYQSRWNSTILLAAEQRLEDGASIEGKSTVEIDKKKLDKLRDGVLDQLKRKKRESKLKRDIAGGIRNLIADVSWTAMPLVALCIIALTGFLIFKSVTAKGVSSKTNFFTPSTWQSDASTQVASNFDAISGDSVEPPKTALGVPKEYSAVQQPVHLVTNFGEKLNVIVNQKPSNVVPVTIDDTGNLLKTWWATLQNKVTWMKLGTYGLLDNEGNFYFDVSTKECQLAEEMNRMSTLRATGYTNPFTQKKEQRKTIAFKGDTINSALQKALKSNFWKKSKAGAVYEVKLAGNRASGVLYCGLDRNGKVMPFALPLPSMRKSMPKFEGVVVSGQQNRFSAYLLIGTLTIVAAFVWFVAIKIRRPRSKYLLGFVSVALIALSIRACMNIW